MYIIFIYNAVYILYLYATYLIVKQMWICFGVDYKIQINVSDKTLDFKEI